MTRRDKACRVTFCLTHFLTDLVREKDKTVRSDEDFKTKKPIEDFKQPFQAANRSPVVAAEIASDWAYYHVFEAVAGVRNLLSICVCIWAILSLPYLFSIFNLNSTRKQSVTDRNVVLEATKQPNSLREVVQSSSVYTWRSNERGSCPTHEHSWPRSESRDILPEARQSKWDRDHHSQHIWLQKPATLSKRKEPTRRWWKPFWLIMITWSFISQEAHKKADFSAWSWRQTR